MDSNLIAAIAVAVVLLLRFVFGGKKKASADAGVRKRPQRQPLKAAHSGDWIESTSLDEVPAESGAMPSQFDPALEGAPAIRQSPPRPPFQAQQRQRTALRRPSDMRSAIVWGELLRRKF